MTDETDDMEVIGEFVPELEEEILLEPDEDPDEGVAEEDAPLPKQIKKKSKLKSKPKSKPKPKVKSKPKPKPKPKQKKKVKAKVENKVNKKRGPKGAQWKSWKIPYQDSCTMGKVFLLAMKKGGIKLAQAIKIFKESGGDPTRGVRCLKSGHCRGWLWDSDDSHNRIRVSNVRIGNKNWKKK
jgi:hypothetical protein